MFTLGISHGRPGGEVAADGGGLWEGGGGPKLGVCDWALVASSTYRRSFRYLKTLEDAERTKRDPF